MGIRKKEKSFEKNYETKEIELKRDNFLQIQSP